MPNFLKSIVRSLTPPVVWDCGRKIKRQISVSNDVSLGKEQPADYYDHFGNHGHMKKHYTGSKYYPTWLVIADHMLKSGSKKILDIGCGPGQFARLLIDNGFTEYIGIDFSELRINHGKKLCPQYTFLCKDVFEQGLIEDLDYDTVIMTEFLEHINDDIAVFQRLKPGSMIFGTVPSFGDPAHVRKYETADEIHHRYGHLVDQLEVKTVPLREDGHTALQLFEGVRNNNN